MRSDPPRSLPSSSPLSPAAIAAADPPDDPPGVRRTSHGLLVVPKRSLYDCASPAKAGKFVLPKMIAPAARSRPTASASCVGHVVGKLSCARGRALSGRGQAVFDRDRQPMQGTARLTTGDRAVCGICIRQCALGIKGDNRVERGIEAFNAFEVDLEQLAAGDLPLGQQLHERSRRREGACFGRPYTAWTRSHTVIHVGCVANVPAATLLRIVARGCPYRCGPADCPVEVVCARSTIEWNRESRPVPHAPSGANWKESERCG